MIRRRAVIALLLLGGIGALSQGVLDSNIWLVGLGLAVCCIAYALIPA